MSEADEIAEEFFPIEDFRCALLAVRIARAIDDALRRERESDDAKHHTTPAIPEGV